MSSSDKPKKSKKEKEAKEHVPEPDVPETTADEDVIDLCDDHDYQVLSAVLETESGKNVAEILSKIQKDVHLMATSINQLIQLSIAAQKAQVEDSESESDADE